MTIAIFGVTADPFTIAHRAIVEEVINKKITDKVIIVPSFVTWHRHDKSRWLNDEQRKDSIERIMRDSSVPCTKWSTDLIEFNKVNTSNEYLRDVILRRRRFIDTLCDVIKTEQLVSCSDKDLEFKVVIGADEFNLFKKWADWDSIIKLAKLVVVLRGDTVIDPDVMDIDHETILLDKMYDDVSATKIREQYKDKSYKEYIADTLGQDIILMRTPIFNLVESHKNDLDFHPVKIVSNDWVSILAQDGDNFIVVKQMRYGLMRSFMEFPCGIVEAGENPAAAAARELSEETGIELINWANDFVYLGKIPTNPAFMTNYMHYFYVDLEVAKFDKKSQHLDEHEKLVASSHDIDDLFYRAYNTEHDPSLQTPALMCTALFLYNNYRKNPSLYKSAAWHNERKLKEINNEQ